MYCSIEELKKSAKKEFFEMAISDEIVNGIEEIEDKDKVIEEQIKNILEEAVKDASSEINGYLLKKYNESFLKKSTMIQKICKDISLYNVLSRSGNDEDSRENNYYLRYKTAIKFLETVAQGKIEIGTGGETDSGESANIRTNLKISSSKKIFGRGALRGL